MACAVIAHHQRPTLVVVDRQRIGRPVAATSRTSTSGSATRQIGQIGGGRNRPTGIVDVAMLQSLARKRRAGVVRSVRAGRRRRMPPPPSRVVHAVRAARSDAPMAWTDRNPVPAGQARGDHRVPMRTNAPRDQTRRRRGSRTRPPRVRSCTDTDTERQRGRSSPHPSGVRRTRGRRATDRADLRGRPRRRSRPAEPVSCSHSAPITSTPSSTGSRCSAIVRSYFAVGSANEHAQRVDEAIANRAPTPGSCSSPPAPTSVRASTGPNSTPSSSPSPWHSRDESSSTSVDCCAPTTGKHHVELHDYVDTRIPVLERMHIKRLPAYASLSFEVPKPQRRNRRQTTEQSGTVGRVLKRRPP